MEMTQTIVLPQELCCFLTCTNKADEFRRDAFILYPYIQNKTISHGRAAEILGVSKRELIDFYGDEGFPYIDLSEEEINQDVDNIRLAMRSGK